MLIRIADEGMGSPVVSGWEGLGRVLGFAASLTLACFRLGSINDGSRLAGWIGVKVSKR